MTGNPAGFIARQIDGRVGDIPRGSLRAERYVLPSASSSCLSHFRHHWGPNESDDEAVRAYAKLGILSRDCTGQPLQSCFGRRVTGKANTACCQPARCRHGRNIDDTAATGRLHPRYGMLARQHGTGEIDIYRFVPAIQRQLFQRTRQHCTDIVLQHVDASERGVYVSKEFFYIRLIGCVCGEYRRRSTSFDDFFSQSIGPVFRAVDEDYNCTFSGEEMCCS